MLRNEFYIGVVSWDGTKNAEARHESIIDRVTFEKVEQVLKSAMLSGNRTRKHKHYLRGSIYCGHCGRRMVFHRIRGKGGIYDYLGCLSHQGRRKHACAGGYVQTASVERAIVDYYAGVRLTARQQQTVRVVVREYAESHMHTAQRESDRHARRLQELHREQQKLLHFFYKGSIGEEVLLHDVLRGVPRLARAHLRVARRPRGRSGACRSRAQRAPASRALRRRDRRAPRSGLTADLIERAA
jgi:site-specific DNA recombinase